ncbi:uncharacterized protein LOC144981220 isoform X2 [Oryzias latipes]
MEQSWMLLVLFLVSMALQTIGQSGDDKGGSGFDLLSGNSSLRAVGDEPGGVENGLVGAASLPSSSLSTEALQERCFIRFSTRAAAPAQTVQREEMAVLQAIQLQNKEVMERLDHFVKAELSDQSYEDAIKRNIVGIQDDLKVCSKAVEKAEEDLERQLGGETPESITVMQKKGSAALESLLQTAEDVASRLEGSWQNLEASFTRTNIRLHR